jgi:hypothetical protein
MKSMRYMRVANGFAVFLLYMSTGCGTAKVSVPNPTREQLEARIAARLSLTDVQTPRGPLQPCGAEDQQAWDKNGSRLQLSFVNLSAPRVDQHFGVRKSDPEGWLINKFVGGVGRDWMPLGGFSYQGHSAPKRTLCGSFARYEFYESGLSPSEHDWNIFIEPAPDEEFQSLLGVSQSGPWLCPPPEQGYNFRCSRLSPRVINKLGGILKGWHSKSEAPEGRCRPGTGTACLIEAEITPPESLRERAAANGAFPKKEGSRLDGKKLCVYGPWVAEAVHFHRPEIHPSEAVWWEEQSAEDTRVLHAISAFDTSGRFDYTRSPYVTAIGPGCSEDSGPDARCLPTHSWVEAWVNGRLDGRYSLTVEIPKGASRSVAITALGSEKLVALEGRDLDAVLEEEATRLAVHSAADNVYVSIPRACDAGNSLRAWVDVRFRLQDDDWMQVRNGYVWLQMTVR